MSEYQDLIAATHEVIETWDMDDGALIPRLVAALEMVRAERDSLRLALQATDDYRIADWQKLEQERDEAEVERDELAAVVEQVRATLEHYNGQSVDVAPIDILDMLPAPSATLDRVKGERNE